MHLHRLPFQQIPQLSNKDIAYASANPALRPFYQYEVSIEAFEQIIEDKKKDRTDRELLVKVLQEQYTRYDAGAKTLANIAALGDEHTYTITTAHQPSLLTGPLYFIYKCFSTINLAESLNQAYSGYRFVPVFVLGSEDHDFEEINHIQLFGKKFQWENEERGPCGKMSAKSLLPLLASLSATLGTSDNAQEIMGLVEEAYTAHETFGAATVHLVSKLFSAYGLVVLDMNHAGFKHKFEPYMRRELLEQASRGLIESTTGELEAAGFSGQAHARDINLFYMRDQLRERIVLEQGQYKVLNTNYSFTQEEILEELAQHPEHFSPNVIMRPLFQECILPNLAYIGGGGEIAYWLERKAQFAYFGINFPMLIRRNSVCWIDKNTGKRLEKLGLRIEDLLEDTETIIRRYVQAHTAAELSLKDEKTAVEMVFKGIGQKALKIDATLEKAVLAEAAKQIKSLEQLEDRLLRAEKQRHEVEINQLRALREKLFPGNGLQERHDNLLPYFLAYGWDFFRILKENLDPLEPGFIVIAE